MDFIHRDHQDEVLNLPRPRVFRERTCPFDTLNDTEFRKRYRFTRKGFFAICDMMKTDLDRPTQRSCPMTTAQRLALTLQVLSSNQFQLLAADASGVSQTTASRVIGEVSDWFLHNTKLFVSWHTEEEEKAMQLRVYGKHKLPGIVGVIDGSHVRIQAPTEGEEGYANRKGYHSINVAAIVDDTYRFLWLAPQWPGRCHDSKAWRSSELHDQFARGERRGRLIGDSAYKAEPFLLKIFPGTDLSEQKVAYNNAICAVRVAVEQAFGQMKRQFHILHGELRYAPYRSAAIITTCVCLRNAAIALKEPILDLDDIPPQYDQPDPEHFIDTTDGKTAMNSIANSYFN